MTTVNKLTLAVNAAAANHDKVVDVSNLKQDGTGFKTVPAPRSNVGRTKRSVGSEKFL